MHARVNRGRTRANKGFGVRSPGEWQDYDCCHYCHVSLSVYAGDAHTMLLPPLSCARDNTPSWLTSLFSPASSYLLVLQEHCWCCNVARQTVPREISIIVLSSVERLSELAFGPTRSKDNLLQRCSKFSLVPVRISNKPWSAQSS